MRICLIYIIITFLTPYTVVWGNSSGNLKAENNWDKYEGLLIDSIIIDNQNIYSIETPDYDNFFFKLANKLHIKTKITVIEQEILLEPGSLFSNNLAEETIRNLRNRLKLYDAFLEIHILPNKHLKIIIITIDAWSLRSGFEISREGNENNFKAGLEEQNLLGFNKLLSFYYIKKSNEESYVESSYLDQYLLGQNIALRLNYKNNPINSNKRIIFSKPFYNLNQSFKFSFSFHTASGRYDIYNDNINAVYYNYTGDDDAFELLYRFGSYRQKYTFGLYYLYYNKRYFNKTVNPLFANEQNDYLVKDSLYHKIETSFKYSNFSYITKNNIDGLGYTEDFTMGFISVSKFARAFKANFKQFDYNYTQFGLAYSFSNKTSLLFLSSGTLLWFKNDNVIRNLSGISVQYYNQINNVFTTALRGFYVSDNIDNGTQTVTLGGTSGIRGYNRYYLTGNKKILINLENRFFSNIKFLSLVFGGVLFTDYGRIYKPDNQNINEIYSYGAGLRIGFEKATQNIIRIDFIRTKSNNWEISIGTGQYFLAGRLLFID